MIKKKILKYEVKSHIEGKKREESSMIIHMSHKNTNLYIPIPLTICLCLVVGNNLVKKLLDYLKT